MKSKSCTELLHLMKIVWECTAVANANELVLHPGDWLENDMSRTDAIKHLRLASRRRRAW